MAIDTPSSDGEKLALAALFGGVGLGLLGLGLGLFGKGNQNPPGENLGNPTLTPPPPLVTLPHGSGGPETSFSIHGPTVMYTGPGRNTYTVAQVLQNGVTVMASGIAGVFVGPASTPTSFPLVSPQQVQPCPPSPDQRMTLFSFQSTDPCASNFIGFCGAPSVPGYGDLHLQIYQDSHESGNPCDGNGLVSPTCGLGPPSCAGPRKPYRDVIYPRAVRFT